MCSSFLFSFFSSTFLLSAGAGAATHFVCIPWLPCAYVLLSCEYPPVSPFCPPASPSCLPASPCCPPASSSCRCLSPIVCLPFLFSACLPPRRPRPSSPLPHPAFPGLPSFACPLLCPCLLKLRGVLAPPTRPLADLGARPALFICLGRSPPHTPPLATWRGGRGRGS